jgi:hypothetical protein
MVSPISSGPNPSRPAIPCINRKPPARTATSPFNAVVNMGKNLRGPGIPLSRLLGKNPSH